MVYVPGGVVRMRLQHERRECGCIPDPGSPPALARRWAWGDPFSEIITHDYSVSVRPFWIDECPVTNAEFEAFIRATGYRPAEPRNFLKHWRGRRCPPSLRDHPVVYVDLDDARAYARWAGKRLPSEPEWQLAAQGTDGRLWPWGDPFDASRCNTRGKGTTPVRAFPKGRSPFGCYDVTGNVWQWTDSETSDGHTRSCIIRGGSWFDAKGSIWYVHGGPQPLNTHTRFLMLYPGLDRCATIGFRCVQDAVQ
jgi:formylglycine-generating enzyme required for sulfatase activity